MKKIMKQLLLGASICTGAQAQANIKGNGGDALYCNYGDGRVTARLYDFFEMEAKRWGLTVDLGHAPTFVEKVNFALERLSRIDALRAEKYRLEFDFFLRNYTLVTADLPDVPDTGDLYIDPECRIQQLAIQKNPEFPRDKYFSISERLWKLLPEEDKAGLVLHEIIYKETIAAGQEDSRKARYMNANLVSDIFDSVNTKEYIGLLQTVGLSGGEYLLNGSYYQTNSMKFYPQGQLASATLSRLLSVRRKLRSTDSDAVLHFPGTGHTVGYYENGQIKSAVITEPSRYTVNGNEMTLQQATSVQFTETGIVTHLGRSTPFEVAWLGHLYSVETVAYDLDGNIQQPLRIKAETTYIGHGCQFSIPRNTQVWLHSNGNLKKIKGGGEFNVCNLDHLVPIHCGLKSDVDFHESGSLASAELQPWTSIKVRNQGVSFDGYYPWTDNRGRVQFISVLSKFYETGAIRFGLLSDDSKLTLEDGSVGFFPQDTKVEFDREGRVTRSLPR